MYYLLQMPILLCMQGDVSFDNIGRALLQVLQVVSLESWSTTQMYYLLDGIGNLVVIYYFCLIVIGTYFALNLLVAVISAKFAQLHVSSLLPLPSPPFCLLPPAFAFLPSPFSLLPSAVSLCICHGITHTADLRV